MIEAKYHPQPLQVLTTPEIKARIKAIADREKISQAEVVRQLIDASIEAREAAW